MGRVLIRDLEPGRKYLLQARASNGQGVSDWSTLFDFTTIADGTIPNPVTSLSWTVVGTAFKATWVKPTVNTDASPLKDFSDYEVTVSPTGSPGTTAVYSVFEPRFDFSLEANRNAFGTPQADLTISVKARDNTGNKSSATTAAVANPAPANVTGFDAVGVFDAIAFKWNAVADTDLKFYRIRNTTSGSTIIYEGLATTAQWDTVVTTSQSFSIVAVDVFGTESVTPATDTATAKSTFAVDTTAPGVPTSVTATPSADGSDPSGSRVKMVVAWTPPADTDVQEYVIRYGTDGTTWQYLTVPGEDSAGTKTSAATILGLVAGQSYYVGVQAVDFTANFSAFTNAGTYPQTTSVDSVSPSTPSAPTLAVNQGGTRIQVSHDLLKAAGGNLERDLHHFEVHASTTTGFSATTTTKIGDMTVVPPPPSGTPVTAIQTFTVIPTGGTTTQTWFVKVIAVDNAGNKSPASAQNSGAVPLLSGVAFEDATITDAKVFTLSANKITAGTGIINDLLIKATLTIDTAGILKSSNYSAGTAGYQLTNTTLEINQGTIRAAALLLQDSQNIVPPQYADFEFIPAFYTVSTLPRNAITTLTIASATPKYNSQYLSASWTTAGSNPNVVFSTGNTTYNIDIEPGEYIYSAWIRNPGSVSTVVNGIVKPDDASNLTAFTVTPPTSSATWVRYSGVVTIPAGRTKCLVYLQSTTLTTGAGFDVDGIQFERKATAATTPSPFRPPSTTSINGGAIRTGTIQSTTNIASGPQAGQPMWSINTAGSMQIGDGLVRGSLIVGAGGDVTSVVKSQNFAAGALGWQIGADGDVEFNDGIFRGNLEGATIEGGSILIPSVPSGGDLYVNDSIFRYFHEATTNLCTNPSFKTLPTVNSSTAGTTVVLGGAPKTDFVLNTDIVYKFGRTALKYYNTTTANAIINITIAPTGTLLPNTTYTLSFYAATGTATTDLVTFAAQGNAANFKVLDNANGVLATGYKTITLTANVFGGGISGLLNSGQQNFGGAGGFGLRNFVTFTTGATVTNSGVRLQLPCANTSAGVAGDLAFIIDGVQLEAKAYPTKYCDGDQPWCGWNGTAHASTSNASFGRVGLLMTAGGDAMVTGDIEVGQVAAANVKRGTGAPQGTNFVYVIKSSTAIYTSGTWQDVSWDVPASGDRVAQDDGAIMPTLATFASWAPGMYVGMAVVTPGAGTTGLRGARWITQGGTVIANYVQEANSGVGRQPITVNTQLVVPGNGYTIRVQTFQSQGANETYGAHSATQPQLVSFAQIG